MAYVYRHIRLDKNEPFYIGIGSDNKFYQRSTETWSRNKYWKNIVNKSHYEIDIILDNLTIQEARLKEIEFIALYKRKSEGGTLVNLTIGGEGQNGIIRNEEYRLKLKENAIKRWSDPAFKEKMKIKLNGRKLPPVSEETKLKLSLLRKGVKGLPLTEETKEKLRQHNLGKIHSQETKNKCREKSLKMWSDKEKAESIKKSMIGKKKRCKNKVND